MTQVTRIKPGPHRPPAPGTGYEPALGSFEAQPDSVKDKILLTIAGTALAIGTVVGGVFALSAHQNDNAPSVTEIKNSTPTTQPVGYDPDKANPSGIDTYGG